MQKQILKSQRLILLGNNKEILILLAIFLLTFFNNIKGQDKLYRIADYELTFYFDSTESGVPKTVYGNRYIKINYIHNNLLRVDCYRSSDSSIIEKGNYLIDTIAKTKLVTGKSIDTGSTVFENITYYELVRKGTWCFFGKRKVQKKFYS